VSKNRISRTGGNSGVASRASRAGGSVGTQSVVTSPKADESESALPSNVSGNQARSGFSTPRADGAADSDDDDSDNEEIKAKRKARAQAAVRAALAADSGGGNNSSLDSSYQSVSNTPANAASPVAQSPSRTILPARAAVSSNSSFEGQILPPPPPPLSSASSNPISPPPPPPPPALSSKPLARAPSGGEVSKPGGPKPSGSGVLSASARDAANRLSRALASASDRLSYDEAARLARCVRAETAVSMGAAAEAATLVPKLLYAALTASDADRVLEVDAAQWSALPLWAQRSRLEKAHLVVD
jgi:hypothetical protein